MKNLKCTQRYIREIIAKGEAVDLTRTRCQEIDAIREKEGYFIELKYSVGVYGCNGKLIKGHNTGTIYAVGTRTSALWRIA